MWRIARNYVPGSLSNPSVHSLSVTLGNHAFHDLQTYNWPCPVGHLPILEMTPVTVTGRSPAVTGFVAILLAARF